MKHYSKWICGALATVMLAACSNELEGPDSNGPVNEGEGVFMKFNISMPSAENTRSFTNGDNSSNDGTEVGKDFENNVNEVRIVLAKADNSYIADALISSDKLAAVGANNEYRATSKFSKTALTAYYDAAGFSRDVKIFLFVNPNSGISGVLDTAELGNTSWYDAICKVSSDNSIWSTANNGSFVMSNVYMATRTLPADMTQWNSYSTEATAFDLSGMNKAGTADVVDNLSNNRGAIKVHRMAARFDFKDGSPATTDANTYEVVFEKNEAGERVPIVNIQLNKMALVNINNSEWYLERTSADGTYAGNGAGLLDPEKPWYSNANGALLEPAGNYVVDAWWSEKKAGIKSGFSTYFDSPFFDNSGKLNNANAWASSTAKIADVLKGDNDEWNNKEYHIWRYATENTIPSPTNLQTYGITTSVVFKGKMIATDNAKNSTDPAVKALYDALMDNSTVGRDPNTDPILYQYNGSLYVTWDNIKAAAIAASFDPKTQTWNRSNSLYVAVFGNGGTGYKYTVTEGGEGKDPVIYEDKMDIDPESANFLYDQWATAGKPAAGEALTAFKSAVTNAGITIYQSSYDDELGWGYYCYYYYMNRHNYNGDPGIMGPMEFGVVRNNVYKLAVTKINQLGHPRIPENDPDQPKPDTPDESSDVYMTVTAQVIPWVVRVNDIEF